MNCICKPIVIELLENAVYNGSKLAEMALTFINNKEEIVSKSICNYFDVITSIEDNRRIYTLTACMKDITNPNFPGKDDKNSMWDTKYRTIVNIQLLLSRVLSIKNFRAENPDEFERELLFLNEIFGLPKFKIKIGDKVKDFYTAYNGENYSYEKYDSTLHNSCMRYREKAKVCADFYSNLANCKILYVTDIDENEIFGRAIIWDNVKFIKNDHKTINFTNTLMDRVYYSNQGVRILIDHYAKKQNWVKKTKNTYDSKIYFSKVVDSEWSEFTSQAFYDFNLDNIDKYNLGAPYLDTFSFFIVDTTKKMIRFTNYDINTNDFHLVATMTSTSCQGSVSNICAICGSITSRQICHQCESQFHESFGILYTTELVEVDGIKVPIELIDKKTKKLTPYIKIKKLLNKISSNPF